MKPHQSMASKLEGPGSVFIVYYIRPDGYCVTAGTTFERPYLFDAPANAKAALREAIRDHVVTEEGQYLVVWMYNDRSGGARLFDVVLETPKLVIR